MDEQTIIELLKKAKDSFWQGNAAEYTNCLTQVESALKTFENPGSLIGELLLVFAMSQVQQLDQLYATLQEASKYLHGKSKIFGEKPELFGYLFHVFAICNPSPGHADENSKKLKEITKLYNQVTGGGFGTDICYDAQLAYYRGEFEDSRALAKEALNVAENNHQYMTALCAMEVLLQIAKHEKDEDLWASSIQYLEQVIAGERLPDPVVSRQAQLVESDLKLSVGLIHPLPRWIQNFQYHAVAREWGYQIFDYPYPYSMLSNALMVQMEHYSYSEQYPKALHIGDLIQTTYKMDNVILNTYVEFMKAGCFRELGDVAAMKEALSKGIETIAPDGLWLIPAVFAPAYEDVIYELAAEYDTQAPEHLHKISRGYWKKLFSIRQDMLNEYSGILTAREREVIGLYCTGMTVKEVSTALHISLATTKTHLSNIFRKLNVDRKEHLEEAFRKLDAIKPAVWTSDPDKNTTLG